MYLSSGNDVSDNTISNFYIGLEDGDKAKYSNVSNNNFIENNHPIFPDNHWGGNKSSSYHANYYTNFDNTEEGCSDNNQDGICDSAYTFISWLPTAFDPTPWVTQDGWLNTPDASGVVTSSGGTVATDDGGVVIDVPAGSVTGNTTITVDLVAVTEPDIVIGDSADTGTALAVYDFGPDGTDFYPEAIITLTIDVTDLNSVERSLISIYRHEDTDYDGDIDSDDGYVEIEGAECVISVGSNSTVIATCTAPISHFSTYAIVLPDDDDGDGVANSGDICPSEVSTGFDIDKDGCIDSFSGLTEMVTLLVDSGVISEQMKNSLISKIENADKSISKDNACTAINQLQAFQNQIEAQREKKVISDAAADDIVNYTNSIIAYYSSQLPSGDSCK